MTHPASDADRTTPDTDGGRSKRSVGPRSIRGRVVAGILLIIPVSITFVIIRYVYAICLGVGSLLLGWVARAGIWALKLDQPVPKFDPADATWYESLLAVVLTLVMLYLLGWLVTNAVGRRLIEVVENLFRRIPFVDTIYGAVKRMVEALSGSTGDAAQGVVVVDFPTESMKAVAFMTNIITDAGTGRRYASVFVPTAPNPTSGYMELVPLENVTPTNLSVESALSMILSGGASAPPDIRFLERGAFVHRASPSPAPITKNEKT